ncbi:MAG: hypothetical protein JKY68_06175 [Rhodospirillales bacterium]|nr:hypothetical protein [Rhodospirillales bacterium]
MSRLTLHKTSFTAGEISPRLLGRGDLTAYENGAAKLRNVFIHPTGGVSRRPGLRFIDTARGNGRLVAFEFNTEQVYLLVFTDSYVDVYRDGIKTASFAVPWTESQIRQIAWVQTAETHGRPTQAPPQTNTLCSIVALALKRSSMKPDGIRTLVQRTTQPINGRGQTTAPHGRTSVVMWSLVVLQAGQLIRPFQPTPHPTDIIGCTACQVPLIRPTGVVRLS